MKQYQKITFAIFASCFSSISLTYSANAESSTIFTAPLLLFADQSIECNIVNISNRERRVVLEIFLSKTTKEVVDMDYHDVVLSPGAAGSVGAGCLSNCGLVYCKFTVEGSKHSYRVSACLQQPDENYNTFTSCITEE